MSDPFRHHPELRAQITPFAESFFRDFDLHKLALVMAEHGIEDFPVHSDARRETLRAEALGQWSGDDLWVFAYGSLMWNPALDFAEVRRAHAPGHERKFILRDIYGARGTAQAPGLMAALDAGHGCAGLAFRIAAQHVDRETDILFKREMVGPGYHAVFVPVEIDGAMHRALTFLADHDSDIIASDITRDEQLACILTGHGFLGSTYDYVQNVVAHLHDMGIPDPDLDALMAEVDTRRARATA